MKSAQFGEVWSKTASSMVLVAAILTFLVAPLYESVVLIQVMTATAFVAFWGGAGWALIWVTREMQWKLSRPLPLIDEYGKLHPFMKVGGCYQVVAFHDLPWRGGDNRLYLLQGKGDGENNKVFCVWTAHDYVLPQGIFQVVKKTEDRGGVPTTSFVFV